MPKKKHNKKITSWRFNIFSGNILQIMYLSCIFEKRKLKRGSGWHEHKRSCSI